MTSNLRVTTTIIIDLKIEEVNAIYDALQPDNKNFPDGIEMKMNVKNKTLIIEIGYHSTAKITSYLNTIDEILEHVSVAKKVIENA